MESLKRDKTRRCCSSAVRETIVGTGLKVAMSAMNLVDANDEGETRSWMQELDGVWSKGGSRDTQPVKATLKLFP